ncbi:heterokaryon incompatibility protein-domain-containing protein [Xylaria telfairii]|nr:heterokaryon incompatibility protein-domain-containing protein [Xylaria telfairii]
MSALCDVCANLTLERPANRSLRVTPITEVKHHDSLAALKECFASKTCAVCHLFWTGITKKLNASTIAAYLDNKIPLPNGPGLVLVIDWQDPAPEQLADSNVFRWLGRNPTLLIQVGKHNISQLILAVFDIFAPLGSAAGTILRGRDSSWSGDDRERTITTKKWLENCYKYHPRCGGRDAMPLPTRVIDLGDPDNKSRPKLLITNGLEGRYVALSYCWGTGRGIHKLKLRTETLQAFQVGIDEGLMTRAHREGLQITRELGYRYIWIDALCIIQGSDALSREDWAREAIRIPQVYGNAELTIVAGRSEDSRHGFIAPTSKPAAPPASLLCSLPGIGLSPDFWIGLKRSRDIGPTDLRAYKEQLSFKCREREDYEDGHWDFHGRHDGWYDLTRDPTLPRYLRRALPAWYALTVEYSKRSFFDPTDNFAALAGVAFKFQKAIALEHSNTRYLAGLWEVDMIAGLLWRSSRIVDPSHKPLCQPLAVTGPNAGKEITIAPSWSWMSLVGPIHQGKETTSLTNPTDPFYCFPTNPDGKTWSSHDWHPSMVKHEDLPLPFPLQVKGHVRKLRCSKCPTSTFQSVSFWQFKKQHLDQVTILMEAAENQALDVIDSTSYRQIIALGQFDLEHDHPVECWALRLTTHEGLLLEQHADGHFGRLGVFVITASSHGWFNSLNAPLMSLSLI